MTDEDPFESYVELVADRLSGRGFAELPESPPDYEGSALHNREFSLWPPGVVDTVVAVCRFGDPDPRTVAEFSSRVFAFAGDHASRLPRGLGNSLVVYPVAACSDPSGEVKEWVTGHRPTHRGAHEFPVVADLDAETVYYYTATPVWGRRRYAAFRKAASAVFDPSADPDLGGL